MKLREYLNNLIDLVKDHPEYLQLEVVYATDDVETFYNKVANVTPEIGIFDEENETFEYYDETIPLSERTVESVEACNAISIN